MRTLILILGLSVAFGAELPKWIEEQGGRVETDARSRVTAVWLPFGWVTDADLDPIAALSDLQTLDLSLSLVSDTGLEKLKNLQNVQDLNLYSVEHITDVAIAYLRGWKKLQRLNLRGTDITDTSVQYLGDLTSLKSLDISYTQVTNNGMEYLAGLPNLEEFSIGGNKVTGAGLRVLRTLPRLTALNLSGGQKRNSGTWVVTLTDRDMDVIADLKQLRSLNLAGFGLKVWSRRLLLMSSLLPSRRSL